jgi:glutathione synthase/RimK-type ligase-like ATP-grasp enzyme
VQLSITGGVLEGTLTYNHSNYSLSAFTGIYIRFIDEASLPELKGFAAGSPELKEYQHFQNSLIEYMEVAECRVVNPYSKMGSNNSKPYQVQIAAEYGFLIPETIITNNPALVKEFASSYPGLIFKSISGVRSIVKKMEDSDWERIHKIKNCPVQFQHQIQGYDVRVHVIGELTVATRIITSNTDYRYINDVNAEYTILEPFSLQPEISEKCVSLSKALGLNFSGIDLRITEDGEVYCFEINPCPGYSYYEKNTSQEISAILAEYLSNHNNYHQRLLGMK